MYKFKQTLTIISFSFFTLSAYADEIKATEVSELTNAKEVVEVSNTTTKVVDAVDTTQLAEVVELSSSEERASSEKFKPTPSASISLTPQQRLSKADTYRFSESAVKTISHVHQYKDGELDTTKIYEVFTKPGKGSLALFKSDAEAGQKVLMQDDNFWIFMPRSRRPLRISPMQKLLGDASVGDLTTLSWAENYHAEAASSLEDDDVLAESEIALDLEAKTKGVSYQKITLVLNKEDNFPLRAKFYMKSGRLAKSAVFSRGEINDKPWVVEMTLTSDVVKSKQTVMKVVSAEDRDIPDKLFNPSFLVRNNLDEVSLAQ